MRRNRLPIFSWRHIFLVAPDHAGSLHCHTKEWSPVIGGQCFRILFHQPLSKLGKFSAIVDDNSTFFASFSPKVRGIVGGPSHDDPISASEL